MSQKHYYTDEKNAQIVIALLKAYGIKHLILSPGATNDCFVLSVQGDPFFKLYSAVDERHAGYLAVGIAEESEEPVVINCTGATASRNYMPALTEAYYRKLPVLAITSSQHSSHIGNMWPQMTDRIHLPSDIVNLSVQCPLPRTYEEERDCELKVNRALLALKRHGGGPVHINLETAFSASYKTEVLPEVRRIDRVTSSSRDWPELPADARIAVWIGSHKPFSNAEVYAIEQFVENNNAVVIGDLTSNYHGKGFVQSALLGLQRGCASNAEFADLKPTLIIHIGEISGDYPTSGFLRCGARVWRVSEDGELRDYFLQLQNVFEMPEEFFFLHYGSGKNKPTSNTFLERWMDVCSDLKTNVPDIPFSNLWIAGQLTNMMPKQSELHLGILNPLRCWDLASQYDGKIYCNVGGFGIDGGTSSLIGASLMDPKKLYFGVFGDLSFFYDLNALGSRHLSSNVRILLINNGEGGEFSVPGNISDRCGERVHDFIAAKGHFGCKSKELVKHLAVDFGFKYLSASSKEEFTLVAAEFVGGDMSKPILLECFTDVGLEREALMKYGNIRPVELDPGEAHGDSSSCVRTVKKVIKSVMPPIVLDFVRSVAGKVM